MIQGINCDISHDEMRSLLALRIAHHCEKEAFCRKHVADVEAERHKQQAATLAFIRDHLVAGETYRLSEVDMGRLGFVPRGY